MSALSSAKINKYRYLTGEEILPTDHSIITDQSNIKYSRLPKAFDKQLNKIEEKKEKIKIKAFEYHGKQLVKSSSESLTLTLALILTIILNTFKTKENFRKIY